MTTADFLFNNQAPGAWTSPSWSNTSAPEWWQAASQGLIAKASQIAGEPYQAYSGPRIAGLDPLQSGAINNATGYIPGVTGAMTSAGNNIGAAGQLFNQGDFNQFMSPYTTGVVDRIAELGSRNLSERLLPEVNDTFTKAGQFGSSRNADFTLRAIRDTNESVLGQQATALENATNNAMKGYQDAQQRQLNSGVQMGALGQMMGAEGRDQLNNQMVLGSVNQNQNQQNLNLAAQDFQNQVNYPQKMLEMMNSILKGYSSNLGQTQTQYTSLPSNGTASPMAQVAGYLNQAQGQN